MATNRTVGDLSQTSGASDWTELERRFFAAAPPEVAVQPPPAPSFDDLEPTDSSAVAARRTRRGLARAPRQPRRRERELAPAGFLRRLARTAWARAQPPSARAWRWTAARLRVQARRLAPSLRATRDWTFERAKRGLGVLASRLAKDLPERPDGKTIAAAMAALIVLFGVSATVLGSRSNLRLPSVPAAAAPLAPIEAAPAAR
ncbi:MAG TPA: hypothetical protein VGK52_15610 [Polyangia bacterium]|jgi:hypothetical protein